LAETNLGLLSLSSETSSLIVFHPKQVLVNYGAKKARTIEELRAE
jgi:hypothetical protein